MARPRARDELLQRFSDRYSAAGSDAAREVEREVIGANVGANGFTTLAQADTLIGVLGLSRTSRLLDVGSGRGWPGLYLAAVTGCRAVLSDLPVAAVRNASRRVQRRRLSRRVAVVRASATHLPFAAATFDAICHADTL